MRACVDQHAISYDRLRSLELLEGDVDARRAQRTQCGVDALLLDHPPEIASLTARQREQFRIGTRRVAKNEAVEHPRKLRSRRSIRACTIVRASAAVIRTRAYDGSFHRKRINASASDSAGSCTLFSRDHDPFWPAAALELDILEHFARGDVDRGHCIGEPQANKYDLAVWSQRKPMRKVPSSDLVHFLHVRQAHDADEVMDVVRHPKLFSVRRELQCVRPRLLVRFRNTLREAYPARHAA